MVNKISDYLVNADRLCDYIPVVSTVSNLVDIFQKAILHLVDLFKKPSQKSDLGNKYFSHIKNKSYSTCALRMVPIIGNVALAILNLKGRHDLFAEKRQSGKLRQASGICKKDNGTVPPAVKHNSPSFPPTSATIKEDGHTSVVANDNPKNEKESLIELIENHRCNLDDIGESLKNDKDVALALLERVDLNHLEKLLEWIGSPLKEDKDVALALLERVDLNHLEKLLEWIGTPLKEDKDVVLALLERVDLNHLEKLLEWIGTPLKEDKDVVLALLERVDLNHLEKLLEWIGSPLKEDKDVALALLERVDLNHLEKLLEWIGTHLKEDKEVVLAVLERPNLDNVKILEWIDPLTSKRGWYDNLEITWRWLTSIGKNKHAVHIFVYFDGLALQFADKSFQRDKEIVLTAVNQNGLALEFADETLQRDKEVAFTAIRQNSDAIRFVCSSLKKDKEFVLAVLEHHELRTLSESFKSDRDFVLTAVSLNGDAFQFADSILKKDKKFAITALKHLTEKNFLCLLKWADNEVKEDKDFITAAMKKYPSAFHYASKAIKEDENLSSVYLKYMV